jgi:8-oxo-dGTP diphosphatase
VASGAGALVAGVAVSEPDLVRAAGGVITRPAAGGIEVLVVHRPRYDDWSLPKGKAEPGEADEETAVREVEEETGLRCTLGDELPPVRYRDRKGRAKQVRYWYMTVVPDPDRPPGEAAPFEPNDEVDECRWISPVGAATLLSYEADRELLRSLGGTDGPAAPR